MFLLIGKTFNKNTRDITGRTYFKAREIGRTREQDRGGKSRISY